MRDTKGRPPVEDRKVPVSISIRASKLARARAMGLDIGSMAERDIDLARGKDPEERELEDTERKIRMLIEELAPLQSRVNYLRENVARKKSLAVDLKVEEDCAAWYLHSLIESGRIRRIVPVPMPEAEIADLCRQLKERKGYDFLFLGSRVIYEGNDREVLRSLAKVKLIVMNGRVVPDPDHMKPFVMPTTLDSLNISVDRKFFTDMAEGVISDQTLVSELRAYLPRITDDRIKEEVKRKMRPFYLEAPDVNVEALR